METDTINILGQEVALDIHYLRLSFFGSLQEADLYKLLKLHNLKHLNLSCSDLSDMHLKTIGQIKHFNYLIWMPPRLQLSACIISVP